MKPLVSVLVPAFDATAIDSALGQSYPNLEIVVGAGAAADAVAALRERYAAEPRVRALEGERYLGRAGDFNHALAAARGEFVLFLPAGDRLLPAHLARLQAAFVRDPGIDVAYSGAYVCDERGTTFGARRLESEFPVDYVDARDELVELLTVGCAVSLPAALFRRALVAEVGPLNEELSATADWEFVVRIAAAGKRFAYLAAPSVCVREHSWPSSGLESVADFVTTLEQTIDPAIERLRGWEPRVVARLDEIVVRAPATVPVTARLGTRIDALRRKLTERGRVYEPARVRDRLISIIVPVNLPGPVFAALDSVVAQTYANWEICLIDQGVFSLENALRAHPAWGRLSVVRLPHLLLPGAARNLGLRMIRGEYVAYLDEDNRFDPGHLESLVEVIERTGSEVAVASTALIVERPDTRFVAPQTVLESNQVFRDERDPRELGQIANATPLNAVLHHRRTLARTKNFSPTLPILEDFEFLMRLEAVTPFAFSGRRTLESHTRLALRAQTLGMRLKNYGAALDAVYAAHSVTAAVAEARAAHAAAVQRTLAAGGNAAEPRYLASLIATLAGRSVIPPAGNGQPAG